MLAGDFNIDLLDFEQNKKVQNFISLIFQFGLVPTTNKPAKITKDTNSAIDHIIVNSIINNEFKTAILTGDISDHFPIIYAFKSKTKLDIPKTQFLYKRIINENLMKAYKSRLHEISWELIKSIKDPNESKKKFIAILTSIYDEFLPKHRIKARHNKNSTPWITRSIAKYSKPKQKLYEKFLKNRTSVNEMNYKNYRRLLESVKRKSKKFFHSKQLMQFQGNF